MKAVRVHAYGGPEALRYEEVPIPTPGAGTALVRLEASGVNFVDIYQRLGQHKVPLRVGSESRRLSELAFASRTS